MVRIVQCLCPERHCIMAAAYEAEADEVDPLMKRGLKMRIAELVTMRVLNPVCGLCGASVETWSFEDRASKYRTLEEARPHLEELEARNAAARAATMKN